MKKFFSIFLSFVMCFACFNLVGCGKKYDYVIGINQFATFNALDDANRGFQDELKAWAKENGKTIDFKEQNAQGEVSNAGTIASSLASLSSIDLIFAIATPCATATASKTKKIPVLYTAVSDPGDAKLIGLPNVTGTSDSCDNLIKSQMDLVLSTKENITKVGILYCTSESNSVFQANEATKTLIANGINQNNIFTGTAQKFEDVLPNLEKIFANDIDVLYIPTDNLMASNMGLISKKAKEKKIPLIVGEEGVVATGGFATVGINYYELGKQTADMAKKILSGEKKASEINFEKYNRPLALTINDDFANYGYTEQSINEFKARYQAKQNATK